MSVQPRLNEERMFKGRAVKKISVNKVLGCAAISITALALVGCEEKKEAPQAMKAPVVTVTVQARDIPANLSYVAKTESSRKVEIYSRITGFLEERLYQEGGLVKEGDVLFTIDAKPFEVQLQQAEASLESSKAAHLVAKQNLDRIRPLAKIKALSQTDLDSAVGQFNTTEAAVSSAQAQVETAKLNLSYTKIHSPVTGLVSSALQTDGTYINLTNAHLATVYTMSPMWVVFSMSENEKQRLTKEVKDGILSLPEDLRFHTDIQIGSGEILPDSGEVTFQSPNYNPNTGTFEIRASVNNESGALRPQQYVRALLRGAFYKNAIEVPQVAVQQGAQSHYVWVINKDGKAEFRPVVPGEWNGENWIINEGLKSGDQVVVEGMLLLGNEVPVQVVKNIDQNTLPASDDSNKALKAAEAQKDQKKTPTENEKPATSGNGK